MPGLSETSGFIIGLFQGGGEAPDEARHSLDLFVQATAGKLAKPPTKPAIAARLSPPKLRPVLSSEGG
jgi:hypothetical protein